MMHAHRVKPHSWDVTNGISFFFPFTNRIAYIFNCNYMFHNDSSVYCKYEDRPIQSTVIRSKTINSDQLINHVSHSSLYDLSYYLYLQIQREAYGSQLQFHLAVHNT